MSDHSQDIAKFQQGGRDFIVAAIPLLEAQREMARVDLYQPIADEVIGGLFARVFRLLHVLMVDPNLWSVDLGSVFRRMMLESVFYMRFLSKQNTPEAFLAFQLYGIGQEKLYKLQLLRLLEEGSIKDTPELREFIESHSDEEISDELVNIQLKNYEDLRKLSDSAGMKNDYVTAFQPDSIVVHGHWPVLRDFYLETCREPLHRMHLQPSFRLPPLNPSMIVRAIIVAGDAYDLWRERYGLEDVLQPLLTKYVDQVMPTPSGAEPTSQEAP
jgi:hypothetical protein